jgi:VWFA-related protein
MYSARRLALPFFLITSALSTCVFGQQAPPPVQRTASTNKIYLDVVVAPKSGVPFPGLQQQDFTLLDNKAPQPITSFRAVVGKDAPVEVILLVDAVNAPFQTVSFERQQIGNFLQSNGGHLDYPTALGIFTDEGVKLQEVFSKDGNSLKQSLDSYDIGLRTSRRSQGFYGAADRVQLSLVSLRELIARESTRPGRKIILWISPGWPLLSGPRMDLSSQQQNQIFGSIVALSTEMRKARVTLYGVDPLGAGESPQRTFYYQEFVKGIRKPSQVDAGDLALQVLSQQSGGLALSSSNDVAELLRRAMRDTESYYEISFDAVPADHANEYHQLDIKLAKPGLTARTREGYYAQP